MKSCSDQWKRIDGAHSNHYFHNLNARDQDGDGDRINEIWRMLLSSGHRIHSENLFQWPHFCATKGANSVVSKKKTLWDRLDILMLCSSSTNVHKGIQPYHLDAIGHHNVTLSTLCSKAICPRNCSKFGRKIMSEKFLLLFLGQNNAQPDTSVCDSEWSMHISESGWFHCPHYCSKANYLFDIIMANTWL